MIEDLVTMWVRRDGVKVVHVEAGLRSFDRSMPEELNRVETDAISDYLFVTEQAGMQNIHQRAPKGEGIHRRRCDDRFARRAAQASTQFARPIRFGTGQLCRGDVASSEQRRLAGSATRRRRDRRTHVFVDSMVLPLHPRTMPALWDRAAARRIVALLREELPLRVPSGNVVERTPL